MNIELLLKVKRHILEEPKRVTMDAWLEASDESPCGTVGCIAGWAMFLSGEGQIREPYNLQAKQLLDLPRADADRLFYVCDWPGMYDLELSRYRPGSRAYARVVALRIEQFIATDGAE